MNREQNKKENYLDQSLGRFIKQYQYEILASLGLISLVGGITLAAFVFKQPSEEITITSTQDSSDSDGQTKIWVDISGAVVNSGTYQLEKGSRVKDILEKAGGLREQADQNWISQYLNQVELLQDGQKIYIPLINESKENISGTTVNDDKGVASAVKTNKVSLNRASLEELISLPGIGPVYAQKIIEARPFNSVKELMQIPGIGSKRYEQIKDMVSVF